MKFKHTPGPYHIEHEFTIFDNKNRLICSCGGHQSNIKSEKVHIENTSNANLIAAAPEMLDALIVCYNFNAENYDKISPQQAMMQDLISCIIERATGMSIEEVLK